RWKKWPEDRCLHTCFDVLMKASTSPLSSSCSLIFTFIKPYLRNWLRKDPNSTLFGYLMVILGNITCYEREKLPNKALCSELWPFVQPILKIVCESFVGKKIFGTIDDVSQVCNLLDEDLEVSTEHYRFNVLLLLANLCCDREFSIIIFDSIGELLIGWIKIIRERDDLLGMKYWCQLITRLSDNHLLIAYLSPKFDEMMKSCDAKLCKKKSSSWYNRFRSNVFSYDAYSHFLRLIRSIPMIATIPTIETSPRPDFDGHSFGLRVCSWLKYYRNSDRPSFEDVTYFDLISGKRMNYSICKVIQSGEYCYEFSDDEKERKKDKRYKRHSSIAKCLPSKHLLVIMPVAEERSLQQHIYDFIERTSAGVELLFEDSFFEPKSPQHKTQNDQCEIV
ncbi:hypothetical protein ADUPG1_000784, partial [Aduncisulcus paluster]